MSNDRPRFAWVAFETLPIGEIFEPIGAMYGRVQQYAKADVGRGHSRGRRHDVIHVPADEYVRVVTTKWQSAKLNMPRKST